VSACALLDNGTVKCWGAGGLLGLGDAVTRGDEPGEMGDALPALDLGLRPPRRVIEIAVGSTHACALLDDASLKCWGSNGHGQLGLGDTTARGDEPGEMGENLPRVDLGRDLAAHVTAGFDHTCVVAEATGHVKCWGANQSGQLGLGDTRNRGVLPGQLGDTLPAVDLGP
jgi:alpha-tubulin suppressor-like RCC1 family protein